MESVVIKIIQSTVFYSRVFLGMSVKKEQKNTPKNSTRGVMPSSWFQIHIYISFFFSCVRLAVFRARTCAQYSRKKKYDDDDKHIQNALQDLFDMSYTRVLTFLFQLTKHPYIYA